MQRSVLYILTVALFLVFSVAGSLSAYSLEKGVFLVAKDQMKDPRFRDRVILLIQHDQQGSAGLVVNRASKLPLESLLDQDSQLNKQGKTLSYGGPVEPNTILALVKVRHNPPQPADVVKDNLYITGVGILDEWPDYQREVVDFRPFVGYTGWAPGQLNAEMQRGDWAVVPAEENDIFSAQDEQLWQALREKASPTK